MANVDEYYKTMLHVYKKHNPKGTAGRRGLIYLINCFTTAIERNADDHCQTAEGHDQLTGDMQKIRAILHPWS